MRNGEVLKYLNKNSDLSATERLRLVYLQIFFIGCQYLYVAQIESLFRALTYLHARGLMHGDVKSVRYGILVELLVHSTDRMLQYIIGKSLD
jgi:hypothetical protein